MLLLICISCHISIHQPGRYCDGSLQCKCHHFVICHLVLLLLFQVFKSLLPIIIHTDIHSSFTIEQTFLIASQLFTIIHQKLYHCSLLQLHINLCHFGIKCGAAICQTKQLHLANMMEDV